MEQGTTFTERTHNGRVFSKGDVDIFRAALLAQSLIGYAKCKMLPTRGVTASGMLKMASQYTGKAYKRGDYMKAAEDLKAHVEFLKASPQTDKPLPRFPV